MLANITSPVANEAEIVANEPDPIINWSLTSPGNEAEYPIAIFLSPSTKPFPASLPITIL